MSLSIYSQAMVRRYVLGMRTDWFLCKNKNHSSTILFFDLRCNMYKLYTTILICFIRMTIFACVNRYDYDTQIKIFTELGCIINENVTEQDILRWGDGKSIFKKMPFSLLYTTLGQTIEREPFFPISDFCWNFDTEFIDGNDSYIYILENMARLSNYELKFENIESIVDFKNQIAFVKFYIQGDKYQWNLTVESDWVDPIIFSNIVELTKKYKTSGKYTYFTTGGQDCVIGYLSSEELDQFNKKTNLNVEWLN